MNHIICGHYNVNYGWGKYLKEVFITGQPLKNYMKVCKDLSREAASEASVGDVDRTPTMPEKKCVSNNPSPVSQPPPPQSSQGSSQVSLHWSQHVKKKPTLTPKKFDSSHREEEHSSLHKHRSEDKSDEKSSMDKQSPKKSHNKSSKEKHHEKENPGTGKDKSGKSSKK